MSIKNQQQKRFTNTWHQSAVQVADERVVCDMGISGSSDNAKPTFPSLLLPTKLWY